MQKIILLHGALGSQKQLEPLKKALESKFEVFSMDFQGHGTKSESGTLGMEDFSKDLLDFMHENNIEKANIFGYSMGGYVALAFAKEHADKVHRIVTLGTKFHWTKESAAEETAKLNPEKIAEKVPAFAKSLSDQHGEAHWKNVVSKTADMMTELGNGKAMKDADFSEIQTNTLLLLAEQDSMVSLAETEKVQIALPNAELQIVPGAKHPLETVNIEKLAEMISEFVKEE